MSMQLPQPPKLSMFVKPFADIETSIKSQIESIVGVKLPPGPAETAHMLMESFEAGKAPELPGLPFGGGGGGGGTAVKVEEVTIEQSPGSARVMSVEANVPEKPEKTAPPESYNEVRAGPVLRIY